MRRYADKALRALLALLLTALCVAGRETAAQTQQPPAAGREEETRLDFMHEDGRGEPAEAPSAAGTFARTLGALLIIVGLVVAAGWGLRRFGGPRFGAAPEGAPELRVLNTVGLGDRRSLLVVRFGGRELLVGSTAQAITLLCVNDGEPALAPVPTARSVAELLGGEAHEPFLVEYSFEDELAAAEARTASESSAGGEA